MDTKKKELLGLFFNRGTQWSRTATAVNTHDFPSYADGRAVPYGIYDVAQNLGYVAVGQSADTPEFAVDAIAWWWQSFGQQLYPDAPELLILADAGGSNGYRPRRWKQQLQVRMADAFDLAVTVCHYPTGASKWNPIEHRLFSQISSTWAGTPLTSYQVVLDALRSTKTTTGLRVQATMFKTAYEKSLSVSDADMKLLGRYKKSNPELCSDRRDGDKPFFKTIEPVKTLFELSHSRLRKPLSSFIDAIDISYRGLHCAPSERASKTQNSVE